LYNKLLAGKMSKKPKLKTAARLYLLSAVIFLITAGCTPDPFFVPVAFIDGVPETGTAGIPLTLTGTVNPAFASNTTINWLIDDAGTTGAALDGNILNTLTEGTVELRAIVPNGIAEGMEYTQYFSIVFTKGEYDAIFYSIPEMKAWLDEQPNNNENKPYKIKLIVSDLIGSSDNGFYDQPGSAGNALFTNPNKYVSLDLSGSTFTEIGNYAFDTCTNLTNITISDNVTRIGRNAFTGTTWLNNQPNGVVYAGKVAYIYKGTMPANTDITLLNGTKGVAVDAFSGNANLTGIIIPNSVTNIGEQAFYNCANLTGIIIPNSVTNIGEQAFYNCANLTSVTFERDDTNLNSAFLGDLRDKYTATPGGGIGTYTTTALVNNSSVWTKHAYVPVTGVTLYPNSLPVTVGDNATLNLAITPDNATNQNVTWSSSDTSVATVDNDGNVTALTPGTATITVTTADGGKTAQCAVTVKAAVAKEARIDTTEYDTLTEAISAAANGSLTNPTVIVILRNIAATRNSTNDYAYSIPKDKYIKLTVESGENRTITASAGNFTLFYMNNLSSALTLEGNGTGTLTLDGGKAAAESNRHGVYVSGDPSFTMNNGVIITGFKNTGNGGGVYANGRFTMNGGEISDNTANNYGGGVYHVGGLSNMSGGKILNNTATNNGGGVFVNGGTFTLSGGSIGETAANKNSATNGGGVYIGGGTFEMKGGKISYNTASTNGGGVNNSNGTFNMSSGIISGNTAKTYGGGVYSNYIFSMISGEISSNETTGGGSSHGGGVYITSTSSNFSMDGGQISSNKATGYGGGVYVAVDGKFTMDNNSKISGNQAISGGGVFVNTAASTFTMKNGEISGNTTTNSGGGVYLNNGTLKLSGGGISSNTVTGSGSSGGGVYLANNGKLEMEGGTIGGASGSENSATNGGGVYVDSGTFEMKGGKILGNTANTNGGGVSNNGTFTMSDGEISDNKTTGTNNGGGGVYNSKNFTIKDNGKILRNTAPNGGGVYATGGSENNFTMDGGEISSNNATASLGGGGGVYVLSSGTKFAMSGGKISGNTASNNGGGVFVSNGTKFAMSGGYVYGTDGNTYYPSGTPNTAATTNNSASIYVAGAAQYDGAYAGGVYTSDNMIPTTNDTIPPSITSTFLQNKINNASAGSTISLPSGNFTADKTITINKEITIDTLSNNVTLSRPNAMIYDNDYLFNIISGGKLTLTASAGGELVLMTSNSVGNYSKTSHIYVNTGGTLILKTGVKITAPSSSNSYNLSGVIVDGGIFNMSGGEISKIGRQSGVIVDSGGKFNMSGGIIKECAGNNGSYAGGVTVCSGNFTMSGNAEISGNYAGSSSSYGGGGIRVQNAGIFSMTGGVIKNNWTTSDSKFGGGVLVENGGTFTKTGGIIYGMNATTTVWNRITENPSPTNSYAGQGYAVYCQNGHKVRDNTADTTDSMDSTTTGTSGGWNVPLTAGAVTISSTDSKVGTPLTASITTTPDGSGQIVYLWKNNSYIESRTTTSTYTPTSSGNYTVTVFRADNSGSVTSSAITITY